MTYLFRNGKQVPTATGSFHQIQAHPDTEKDVIQELHIIVHEFQQSWKRRPLVLDKLGENHWILSFDWSTYRDVHHLDHNPKTPEKAYEEDLSIICDLLIEKGFIFLEYIDPKSKDGSVTTITLPQQTDPITLRKLRQHIHRCANSEMETLKTNPYDTPGLDFTREPI